MEPSRSDLENARWSKEKAWDYIRPFGAIKAVNYVPAYCYSYIQMWFDFREEAIARELAWAKDIGINSLRVFIPAFAYQEPEQWEILLGRLEQFLAIVDSYGMSVLLTLQPNYIKDPLWQGRLSSELIVNFKPGVHWMHSQYKGTMFYEAGKLDFMKPVLKSFVQGIISRYAGDRRVIAWDLYNESPQKDRGLTEFLFACAREINPSQPLTACWQAHEISDVVSFHCYAQPGSPTYQEGIPSFEEELADALSFGRPALCTECLARTFGNTLERFLPVFAAHQIGWYIWGLCAGSSQYHFPWGWPEGSPEPRNWFHCILYPDGTPYRSDETELIRSFSYVERDVL